ncbi:MAG: response regulator [Bacteriovoracaceae bacterium]|nr:response regulator [Bacteriovoracaceae bacterium]
MYNLVFVDDEKDLCRLYKEIFSSSEISVHAFSDCEEAIDYIHNNDVSILFVDFRMPGTNGIQFREKIKKEIPSFLLTGEFLNQEVEGFIKVLEKPVTEELIEVLIERYAKEKHLSDMSPYEVLFMNMPQEVHIWRVIRNSSGKIKTWELVNANPVALKAWGMELEDIIGKTTEEVFPNSSAVAAFHPIVEKIFETGEPCTWSQFFEATNQNLEMISIPHRDLFISTSLKATAKD